MKIAPLTKIGKEINIRVFGNFSDNPGKSSVDT